MKFKYSFFALALLISSYTQAQCNFVVDIDPPICVGYDDYIVPICDGPGTLNPPYVNCHLIFYNSDNIWNIGPWNINNDLSMYNHGVGVCYAQHYPLRCDRPLVLKWGAWGGPNNCPWTEIRELIEVPPTSPNPGLNMTITQLPGNMAQVTVTGAPNNCDVWHQFNLVNVTTGTVVETIAWWQVNPNRYEEGPFTFNTLVPMGPGADVFQVQRGVWTACTKWTATTQTVAVSKSAETEALATLGEVNQFTLSPNPASTEATITFSSPADGVLKVFNTLGQQVYHTELAEMDHTKMDVSDLDEGIYMVTMEFLNGKTHTEKLIVK